jgi:aryl-alcohol dehydrogenase-like predicted oxidoreductase
MAIMTRPLGRTQTDVTILGYGAMELRGADHLDLVQVHMSPSRATLAENHTVQTLQELRDEGASRSNKPTGL